jgi:hypothetical protein
VGDHQDGLLELLVEPLEQPEHLVGRAAVLGLTGGAAGAILALSYPEFLLGPTLAADPVVKDFYMDRIEELQPIWPRTLEQIPQALAYFGNALIVVPYLLYVLFRQRDRAEWDGWLFLARDFGLAFYRAEEPLSPAELDRWEELLTDAERWLKSGE